MDKWMDGQMTHMERQMDGWRWMKRWMDGWMDGWIMQSDTCNTQQHLSMDTLVLCNKLYSRGKNKMYLCLKEFAKHLS